MLKGTLYSMNDEFVNADNKKNEIDSDDYIVVNILEDIVKSKAKDFMIKIGGCDCQHCVSDAIALALNELPSKYTATYKGMLFAMLTSYESQYSADINSALTKACLMVTSFPRH